MRQWGKGGGGHAKDGLKRGAGIYGMARWGWRGKRGVLKGGWAKASTAGGKGKEYFGKGGGGGGKGLTG